MNPHPCPSHASVVFAQNTDEIQHAFKLAMLHYTLHANNSRRLEFQVYVDIINTADSFKISRLICKHFRRGVWSMLGAVTPDSFDTIHSYTNTFQMPFLTPWFPEKVHPPSSGFTDYAVSMRPAYHGAVSEVIKFYGWKSIIFMFDSDDGLLHLQQLHTTLQPGSADFHIRYARRIANAAEAVAFLGTIDSLERWSNKYVVLDTSTRLAKDVLIAHVRDPMLGRRNFHYFLSGLVMDDTWERNVPELFSINVTGFKVLDFSRKYVRDVMELWKRDNPSETMSAEAVLMYDGVQTMINTFVILQKKKPDLFSARVQRFAQQNNTKIMDCNTATEKVNTFEHGDKITRIIRKTEIEGLSGFIRFDEEGHRKSFSLQVVTTNPDGSMSKIGMWFDEKGFLPEMAKLSPLSTIGMYDKNKIFVVTTIIEAPYLMKQIHSYSGKPELRGFCKELLDMIAEKLGIKVEMRLVIDGNFGNADPTVPGGWNGMIGELLRKEADMAIASLLVSPERKKVVDFSIPFLTLDKPEKEIKVDSDILTFLRPLSFPIWLSMVSSVFVVTTVMFLVTKLTDARWHTRAMADSIGPSDHNAVITRPVQTSQVNEITYGNIFWFTVSTFMQQGSDFTPRSASVRIMGAAWYIFVLLIVSTYTAYMTVYLTVFEVNLPYANNRITPCPQEYIKDKVALAAVPLDKPELGWRAAVQAMYERATGAGDIPDDLNENKCDMVISLYDKGFKEFAVALPKQSNLRAGIDLALVSLKDDGVMLELVKKWFSGKECKTKLVKNTNEHGLTLANMSGVFLVLVAGCFLALITAAIEFWYQKRTEAARDNVSLNSALRTNIRRSSRARTSSPPRSTRREHERPGWNGSSYAGFYTDDNQNGQEETELNATFTQV